MWALFSFHQTQTTTPFCFFIALNKALSAYLEFFCKRVKHLIAATMLAFSLAQKHSPRGQKY
jgi:hypothetical protein